MAIPNLRALIADEEGATMVEYGLLVALIAIVAVTAIAAVGTNLRSLFRSLPATL
ncbi:MAG: Flp family type IVb pilin [Candidatus Cybelea sp.]|jgi:pilus assembly protein Flp/PilA